MYYKFITEFQSYISIYAMNNINTIFRHNANDLLKFKIKFIAFLEMHKILQF